jgi:hypothetical protein
MTLILFRSSPPEGRANPYLQGDLFQAKATLTSRSSMNLKIKELSFGVCHEKVNAYFVLVRVAYSAD